MRTVRIDHQLVKMLTLRQVHRQISDKVIFSPATQRTPRPPLQTLAVGLLWPHHYVTVE